MASPSTVLSSAALIALWLDSIPGQYVYVEFVGLWSDSVELYVRHCKISQELLTPLARQKVFDDIYVDSGCSVRAPHRGGMLDDLRCRRACYRHSFIIAPKMACTHPRSRQIVLVLGTSSPRDKQRKTGWASPTTVVRGLPPALRWKPRSVHMKGMVCKMMTIISIKKEKYNNNCSFQ